MNLVNMFEDVGEVAVFEIDNEGAYEQVMDKFGHIIEWSGDYMVAPRDMFTQIEQVAHDAGGAATEVTDDMFEATGLTFMGSPCTKDCSGHKAGYEWSEKRGGQNANSHSQSFNNGAAISVNAKNKQQQPAQQTKPQTAADKLRAKMADLLGPDKAKTFGLAEMDGNGGGRDGSNRKSHSTYGSRDKHNVPDGPDVHLGAKHTMKRKDITKRAGDVLNKEFDKAHKGVAEGFDDFVKGAKRIVKGKQTKGQRETHHAIRGVAAAQAASQTSDPTERDYLEKEMSKHINRFDKVKNVGNKGVAEGKIQYGVLDNDNVNLIIDKSVSKPDGIYSFRGILFRVKSGKVTHYAADGKILQAMGRFNTQIGSYDSSTQAKSILKSIKQGVAESTDMCKVCGQTPCNCTSISEAANLEEKWSQKYKNSINCSNPKGFSQKAHCAGKKKNESVEEAISRRGFLKGAGAAAAAGAAGKASAIAGAFPTPSHQAAMYKAAADSNAAQARADAAAKAKADAERLRANTELVDKEQRVNHHSLAPNRFFGDYPHIDGQVARPATPGQQQPTDARLVTSDEGEKMYVWPVRYGQKGATILVYRPVEVKEGLGDEFGQKELKHTIARARAKFPRAASDTEALIMYVQDQEQQDVRKLNQVNDREDKEINRLDQEEDSIERRLQDVERKVDSMMESRLYYSVVGTVDSELRSEFGLRKDKNGWYLKENADAKKKFQAYKAFGSPKLKEYDLSAVRGGSTGVISAADNPVSPVGSVPRGQQKTKR